MNMQQNLLQRTNDCVIFVPRCFPPPPWTRSLAGEEIHRPFFLPFWAGRPTAGHVPVISLESMADSAAYKAFVALRACMSPILVVKVGGRE
jgi:hypothetical protein